MSALKELLEEKRRRQKAKELKQPAALPTTATVAVPEEGSPKKAKPDLQKKAPDPLETWKAKRSEKRDFSAGEIANLLDGLTPDGYNKKGVKVSFVETGTAWPGGLAGR